MQAIGLEIDGTKIFLASVKKGKGTFEILRTHIIDAYLPFQKKDVKRLYNAFDSKKPFLVTGLPAQDVLLKQVEWKLSSKKALKQALQYQLESQSFLDPKETLFLPQITKISGKSFLRTFLTTKQVMQNHLDFLKGYEIDPEHVSLTSQALWRFAKEVCQVERCLILHIGLKHSTCALMEEGILLCSYSAPFGKENFKEKAQLASFKKELSKTFFSFLKEDLITAAAFPLLLTGHAEELFSSLKETLASYYSSLLPIREEWKTHALAIGLALEGLAKDGKALQFRKNEFIPQSHLRKLGKMVFLYLGINFLIASLLFCFGKREMSAQKEMLSQALYQSVEKDSLLFGRPIPDRSAWEENLFIWQKALKREAKPISYVCKIPKVAEVLYWLATHPSLEEGQKVSWKNVHYELVQYPKLGISEEPYVGKLELQLEFPNPIQARKFHEALLKGDPILLPKSEITWEGEDTSFKTSFYLNPR